MGRVTNRQLSEGRTGTASDAMRAARLGMWATLAVWAIVIVLHDIDIGGEWDPVSTGTWAMIALWLVGFVVAWEWVLQHNSRRHASRGPERRPPDDWSNRWVLVLSAVSAFGAALIIYDFAVLRQYGFLNISASFIRLQESIDLWEGNKDISPVSGLGRLILPAMIPMYYLTVICWKQLTGATRAVVGIASSVILLEQLQFEGGRFLITIVVASMLIAYFLFVRRQQPPARRRAIPYIRIVLVGVVLLSFFANVFVTRILDRGGYFWLAYVNLSTGMSIDVNYGDAWRFEGAFGPLWFSISMLWLYITHGLSQLDLLLSVRYLDHANGMMQFAHIGQIVTYITGIDVRYDMLANVPIAGTYSTFLGQNYIDFGRIGAILSGPVLGALTAASTLPFVRGRIDMISLPAPILLVVCFFTPIVSLVVNAWPAVVWAAIVGYSSRYWNAGNGRAPLPGTSRATLS